MVSTATTHADLIMESLRKTAGKHFQENQWGVRHVSAFSAPQGAEVGIVGLIRSLATYADTHCARFEAGIGEDGFLGPQWETMVRSCRALLNGECGRLDCGTLDGLLLAMLAAEGFGEE